MEPNVRSKLKDAIMDMLFTKEKVHIQQRITDLISLMNRTQKGNWYWYKGLKFEKYEYETSVSFLTVSAEFAPEMEEIYVLTEEFNYNKVILSSYIANALSAGKNVMECFQIFPSCIRDDLTMKFNMSFAMSDIKEPKEHILVFLEKNKLNNIALKEQYTKSILL